MKSREVVVIDAVRTPIGRYGGALANVRPDDLAAIVIQSIVERTGVPPQQIEDVFFGAANQAGEDNRNVARMASLLAGLPVETAGATLNRLCGSSLQAINPDGTATAPADAPAAVQAMVTAANQIIDTSYCVGGGHGKWQSSCYDCSGAVSYVLHAAGLLSSSEDSSDLESYGAAGPGHWVSVYGDPSHAFIVIGGRAFDTANYGGPNIPAGTGPRWRTNPLGNLADGGHYVVRHPPGL